MSLPPESSPTTVDTVAPSVRAVHVDASDVRAFKPLNGVGGVPGPAIGFPQFPDVTPIWKKAGVTLVRSFDWVSRLDTRNNPSSLFPDWNADPDDAASYNFAATDEWVAAVHAIGAEVLFTVASSIPSNKLPAHDIDVYGRVVEHIVRHYAQGWASGPATPIRMFEFGDQPDLGPLHFAGRPEEFYEMYAAFCAAVRRVDESLTVGGPALAFPLNADAAYREGFLSFVRERHLPLDFFSFLWFVDSSRDPLNFGYVGEHLRRLLDEYGFTKTELMLCYWNYLSIPTSSAPSDEKGAFQAAASIYLQDTVIDRALFFRADSGLDPHYGMTDPAGIYSTAGPDERAEALIFAGKTMTGDRLAVTGSDESGFACAASREGNRVRVLVANFVAPESALEEREGDTFSFRIPIGDQRIELSLAMPPQRAALASAGVTSAHVTIANLPWAGRTVTIAETTLTGEASELREARVSDAGTLTIELDITAQSATLVEVTARPD
ncbi:GH39 family glycosyl hydrolase [Microbacterium sp.]|uniref:GH39 family glycosyl hydrolase n=1 Tax=Microbacterium sp. TaxID=51671 RepID=UPI003F71BDF4